MTSNADQRARRRAVVRLTLPLALTGLLPLAAVAQDDTTSAAPAVESTPASTAPSDPASNPTPPLPDAIPVDAPATSEPPSAEAAPTARGGLQEIVVTAQKRAENMQDVPISIQAFSGAELDVKGITDPAKLTSQTPGLIYDSLAGFAIIYIRGVGTDAFIPSADLSIATYVDGVYFPFSYALSRAFGDVERVEVLKGPQGTLFGRNSTGGAINIVTKEPSDSFNTAAQVVYGNFSDFQSRLFMTGPIFDSLSASLGVIYNHRNEYYDTTPQAAQDNLQAYQDQGATLKLRWEPADWFDGTLTGYYYNARGTSTALYTQLKPSPIVGAALGLEADAKDYDTSVNRPAQAFNRLRVGIGTLNFHTGPLDLKSISAYQDFDSSSLFDFDGTDRDVASFGSKFKGVKSPYGIPQKARVFTQEFQFLSTDESWGADWLKYVGGVYHIRSTAGFDPVEFYLAGLDDLLGGNALSLLPEPVRGLVTQSPLAQLLTGQLANVPPLPTNSEVLLYGLLDTRSTAYFLQATADVTDWMSLTLGGRYQKERRKVYKAEIRAGTNPPDGPIVPIIHYPDDKLSESNFSPKVTLDFKPFDNVMPYLSWTKGFKSGSFNIINLTSAPTRIKSETVTTYEVGLKTDLFDNRLRFNAAVFRNEIDNLQVQFLSLISGGVVQFENAKRAHINGAEVDITTALADDTIFHVAGAYLKGRYDKYTDASGFNEQTGVLSTGNNYSGNTIVRTPKWTWSMDLSQTFHAPGGPVDLGVGYYFNDGYWFTAQNTVAQPGYGQLSAQLGYLYERMNLRVTLFGDNLVNDRRYLYVFPNDFGEGGKLAPPRTYGVRMNWEF